MQSIWMRSSTRSFLRKCQPPTCHEIMVATKDKLTQHQGHSTNAAPSIITVMTRSPGRACVLPLLRKEHVQNNSCRTLSKIEALIGMSAGRNDDEELWRANRTMSAANREGGSAKLHSNAENLVIYSPNAVTKDHSTKTEMRSSFVSASARPENQDGGPGPEFPFLQTEKKCLANPGSPNPKKGK